MFRLANMLTKSFDLFKDRICCGCPNERSSLNVGSLDELIDFADQIFYAPECAPADGLLRDDIEPDLDLIEPRGVSWSEMDLVARSAGQPALDPRMLMSGIVVHHEMNG